MSAYLLNVFFCINLVPVVFYPCDKQVYCNPVLDFFSVKNFVLKTQFWTLSPLLLFANPTPFGSNIKHPFQNLLSMLVTIFPIRLLKFFVTVFRLYSLRPNLCRLSGLILCSFKRNIFLMLTSRLHKMLKVLIETIVQVFHDNNLLGLFFDLISFGLYHIGLMSAYCAFR